MKNVTKGYAALLLCILFMAVAPSLFAGTAPTLEILSPRNGEDISYGGEVVVAISIYDEDGDVDLSSVLLEVNDVDVEAAAAYIEPPPESLDDGDDEDEGQHAEEQRINTELAQHGQEDGYEDDDDLAPFQRPAQQEDDQLGDDQEGDRGEVQGEDHLLDELLAADDTTTEGDA